MQHSFQNRVLRQLSPEDRARFAPARRPVALEGRDLLMCHDRVEGDALRLTQEVLAVMLGVRRSGITLAMQNLEGAGCIRAGRGLITVRHRERLGAAAGGSYGLAEAFHARLMEAV